MKYLILISFVFISFDLFGQQQRVIGLDERLHFLAGSTVAATVLHLPKTKEYNTWQRIYVGTLAATFVGVGKEFYDLADYGRFSGDDILWTALGGLVTSSINVLVVQKLKRKNKKYR